MISNYFKTCEATAAGNFHKLFIAPLGDIESIEIIDGEVSNITMEGSPINGIFAQANADIDTVNLTETITGRTRQFVSSELTARYSNKSTALKKFIDELRDAIVCGVVVIRVDNNKKAFISGISVDKNFSRPYDEIESTFNSGTSIEDTEEGNAISVILRRRSLNDEIPLDSTLTDSILDESASFIDWTQPS